MYRSRYNGIACTMSPLHIAMTFLSAIGDWLEVCGQREFLEKEKIKTPGRVESLLNGGKVEMSCYAHQMSLVELLNLANEVFKSQSEITAYDCHKSLPRTDFC